LKRLIVDSLRRSHAPTDECMTHRCNLLIDRLAEINQCVEADKDSCAGKDGAVYVIL